MLFSVAKNENKKNLLFHHSIANNMKCLLCTKMIWKTYHVHDDSWTGYCSRNDYSLVNGDDDCSWHPQLELFNDYLNFNNDNGNKNKKDIRRG